MAAIMQRILEPELMDDMEQALAYDRADFSESHGKRVVLFKERYPQVTLGKVLDLGCGSGDVLERFAKALPQMRFAAVDGSAAMLNLAQRRIERTPDLKQRVEFVEALIPSAQIPKHDYALVMSHSLLHHLHTPAVLWATIAQVVSNNSVVFVADLRRPQSESKAADIIDRLAKDEPEVLRRDFYNSLCAAFTADEVRVQLAQANLSQLRVEEVGENHLLIHGYLSH